MNQKVLILVSTYNGERFVIEQLESILRQKDVRSYVLVRDDGSKDHTPTLLHTFAEHHPNVEVRIGENLGWAASFHRLTQWAWIDYRDKVDYFAYCDQDDYWQPNKLAAAISQIERANAPMLCLSNVTITDACLTPIRTLDPFPPDSQPLPSLLVDAFCQGCTFCFNRELLATYIKRTDPQCLPCSHDRWMLFLAAFCGKVVYDPHSYLLYRQSGENVFGALDMTRLPLARRWYLMRNQFRVRSSQARLLYGALKDEDIPCKRELKMFAEYVDSFFNRLSLIMHWRRCGFSQPTFRKNVVTLVKILMGVV